MSDKEEIPDLLPWDLAPEKVLTPSRILEHQAELVGQKSGGRLYAQIVHEENEKYSILNFVVDAPMLEYSVRLFYCSHKKSLPYPTTVFFDGLTHGQARANVEKEFRNLVGSIFDSQNARSVFQSLLARIGEAEDESKETETVDRSENSL